MIVCPGCASHVNVGGSECPHCGGRLGTSRSPSAAVLLLGLIATGVGCPEATNVDYGTASTGDWTDTTESDADADADSDSDTDADTDTDPTGDTGTR